MSLLMYVVGKKYWLKRGTTHAFCTVGVKVTHTYGFCELLHIQERALVRGIH